MRIVGAFLIVALAFILSKPQPQAPRQKGAQTIIASFYDSLEVLAKRSGNLSNTRIGRDIANSLDRITENVKFLDAGTKSNESIPQEYLDGLFLDAELLVRLAKLPVRTNSDRKKILEGLKEVDSDLTLKVAGPRGGGEVTRVVEVVVHARKRDQKMAAQQIWYVPKGWARELSRAKPFDRLSDPVRPSSMKLAPGNYLFWLKDQPAAQRQPASIGANGETRREIELLVP